MRRIGFPWSESLVRRTLASVGGTLAAARDALDTGFGGTLAGGTHHAFYSEGSGFCVFNDIAVSIRALRPGRAAVVDVDVHQGDGTAAIVGGTDRIFALSLHGERNYPARKVDGHLDIGLPDGTGDAAYLAALDEALATMLARFAPTFLVFLADADPHEGDRLGRLRLSFDGLRARDERVFALALRLRVPVAVTMAGGYGREIDATVRVHLDTVRSASAHWRRCRAASAEETQVG